MKPVVSMLLLLMGFSLCACETPTESIRQFSYGYDAKTDLCFAFYHMQSQTGSMTYVPCTPGVLKEIQEEQAQSKK